MYGPFYRVQVADTTLRWGVGESRSQVRLIADHCSVFVIFVEGGFYEKSIPLRRSA